MTPIKFILEIMHKKNRILALTLILTNLVLIVTHILINSGVIPESFEMSITVIEAIVIVVMSLFISNRLDRKIKETMYDRMMEENYEFTAAMYDHKVYTEPQIIPVLMMTSKFIREKMEDKMHDKIGGA